ncbi:MAG TPA: FG-GAP repeat protein [Mycobacteriales bacterium]|nr:FG-GAP repeat protein [Mycobacteriales bacterium]
MKLAVTHPRFAIATGLLGAAALLGPLALAPVAASPSAATPKTRVLLYDKAGAKGDELGYSVATSGKLIAVGVPGRRVNGHHAQGAVDVFVKRSGWRHAKLETRLTLPNGHRNDEFGFSVAIAGSTIVAGTPLSHPGGNASAGSVYVFSRPVGGWRNIHHPTGRLVPSDGTSSDQFGYSIAASGSTVVVGSPGHVVGFHSSQGAVYVFTKPHDGWFNDRRQTAELSTDENAPNSRIGYSVAISGSMIVAGAPYQRVGSNASQGAAYVFHRSGFSWHNGTQAAKLVASNGAANDFFGTAVAVTGSTVAVGAPFRKVSGREHQGVTYVFVRPSVGWFGTRNQSATLSVHPGGNAEAFLGQAVAASGRTIIANGGGVDAVFRRPGSGWSGVRHQHSVITGVAGVANLGGPSANSTVAMSSGLVVAGSPLEPIGKHTAQGAINVFVR